jgi:hypothetical protein
MEPTALTHGRFFACLRRTAAGAALIALAACGGGAAHPSALPVTAPATAAPTATAHFTLIVPRHSASASKRGTQFVSASTQALLFTVTPGNVQSKINLTAGNCTPNPLGTANVCTLAVAAPIGTDTFAMIAYDQPFNPDGTQPVGTNALSAASNFTATIAEGQTNVTFPLIAGGIPKTLSISIGGSTSTTITSGGPSTLPVTVTVYDADNNIIVAPGTYVDAAGNAAPITITSLNGTSAFGYAVTAAGSTVAGATGSTITLNEPDDRVALAYNGSAYVPALDQLAHTVPSNVGGGTSTQFAFGWRFTPPFTPQLLLAPPASISSTIGHKGIVIADRTNHVGFVGDVTRSCAVSSVSAGSVTHLGGITFNAGVSDTNLYVWVNDTAQTQGTGLDVIGISSILANSCSIATNVAGDTGGSTTQGVVAAGGNLYTDVTDAGVDVVEFFLVPSLFDLGGNVIDGGASFGMQGLALSPNGLDEYMQFGAKKRLDFMSSFPGTSATTQLALAGMFDTAPGGLTVDTSGNVYANDTISATYGTNGGIDVFNSTLTETNQIFLGSPLLQTGPLGTLQNIAVGPFGTSNAIYAVTAAGIEVFAFPLAASVPAPTETIALPSPPVSIVTVADGREWVLLADGTLDALPPN